MAFWYDGGTKRDFVEADHLEFLATYENYTWPTIVNYPYQ